MAATLNRETAVSQGGFPQAQCRFVSFDGGVATHGLLQRPDRYRFWTPGPVNAPRIPRGAGLSYVAASFRTGGLSIEHGLFDRVLDFDAARALVTVEAGITLGRLHDFIASRGFYLPVQPGHGRITVGGCIAADVHGKNHARDGTFMNQVAALDLFHPDHGVLTLSPQQEPTLFRLTCGGYGLTGHILRAVLKVSSLPSDCVEVQAIPVPDSMSGVEQLAHAASEADFAYTWHDFAAGDACSGSGYLFRGSFMRGRDPSFGTSVHAPAPIPPLTAAERGSWRLPLLNRWTANALNQFYRRKQGRQGSTKRLSLRDALFPVHEAQTYFKLFGTAGFHEYQVVIAAERTQEYLDAVRKYAARHPVAITLASAKQFKGRPELLRFTGDGTCFALNFAHTSGSPGFLAFLDQLTISLGGRPNIIKDSRLPRSVVDACYPEAQTFRDALRAFDPQRIFRSELSERLGL